MSAFTDSQADADATLYAIQWVASDLRRDFSSFAGKDALVKGFPEYERDFEIIIDIANRLREIRDMQSRVDLRAIA